MDPCDLAQEHTGALPAMTYVQILEGAKNSCRRCGMLEESIRAVLGGKLPSVFQGLQDADEHARVLEELVIDARWLGVRREDPFQRQEQGFSMLVKGERLEIELFRDPEEQDDFTVKGLGIAESVQLGPTTASASALSTAEIWLNQCVDKHKACGKTVPDFRPKRLLDLRGNRIQLIETDEMEADEMEADEMEADEMEADEMEADEMEADEMETDGSETDGSETDEDMGQYVCLSHRWGDDKYRRLQTTTRSIESHKEEIPYDDLPKTFQDAVDVCRRLKANYLWIDSLCILQKIPDLEAKTKPETEEEKQKREKDFATQNAAMGSIYQNSHFTICASISTHMDGGMFSEWSSSKMNVVDDSGKEAVFRIRGKTSHEGPPANLETRGWTFQEYVLPSRVLSFESFDVSWKCRKHLTCECKKIDKAYDRRLPLGQWAQDHPDSDSAEDWGEEWWAAMVRYYSSRDLTNKQDKLPALSGLAHIYNKAFHDNVSQEEYLAGIWKPSLPNSLCWYYWRSPGPGPWNLGRVSIGHRPKKFRAPSWSWASIDTSDGGECCFWEDDTKEGHHPLDPLGEVRVSCTLYEATCNPATPDPFGEVLNGFIKLGVNLFSASIERNNNEVVDSHTKEGKSWIAEMAWTLSKFQVGLRVYICIADCSLKDLEDSGLNLGDTVYCAPILETFSDEGGLHMICLVLRRLNGQEYQRIGFCVLWAEEEGSFAPNPSGGQVFSHPLQYTPDQEDLVVIV